MTRALRTAAFLLALPIGGCVTGSRDVPVVRHETAMPVQLASTAPMETPAVPRTEIVVAAMGTPADEVWPNFDVVVNGRTIGTATASTRDTVHHVFAADIEPEAIERVTVRYTNDKKSKSDRNLFIPYIQINGKTYDAYGDGVTYARSGRVPVMPGRPHMYYAGDLNFPIAKPKS